MDIYLCGCGRRRSSFLFFSYVLFRLIVRAYDLQPLIIWSLAKLLPLAEDFLLPVISSRTDRRGRGTTRAFGHWLPLLGHPVCLSVLYYIYTLVRLQN